MNEYPVTSAQIAAAAAWLAHLRPWQIERMAGFPTEHELYAYLEYRTPDELNLYAVIAAVHELRNETNDVESNMKTRGL